MTSNLKSHRRGLREAFKTILPRRRDDRDNTSDHLTKTIAFLQEKEPSLTLLPTLSSLSSLPNFNSSTFSIRRYSAVALDQLEPIPARVWVADGSQATIVPYVPNAPASAAASEPAEVPTLTQREIVDAYQYQSQLGQLAQTCSTEPDWYSRGLVRVSAASQSAYSVSTRSLLSKTSSNNLVTAESIHFQSPLSQLAHACDVPSVYRYGTSLQASLATLRSSHRSASTLRLQRSAQDLPIIIESPPALKPKRFISIGSAAPASEIPGEENTEPQEVAHVVLEADTEDSRSIRRSKSFCRNEQDVELDAQISSINHFSSFCVLDTASRSCPVTATSQDLRHVFEIGEDFCLDTIGIDGASMDTVTGQDADGNVVVHLIIYNQLINPNSGRSRFVLASMLDITAFVMGTAPLPDLETISEESVVEEEISTPPRSLTHGSPRYGLTTESFAEEHHTATQTPHTPLRPKESDIWLDIASEETRRTRSLRSTPSTPRSRSSATTTSARSMDDILDEFLASLRGLYCDFFLLGKSPLDEDTYEICNVSPKLYNSREYVEGHLSKTSDSDKVQLEQRLTQGQSFRMRVRWGVAGDQKQLYCVPLFGRSNVTWVCFLVEESKWAGMPIWD